jgi:hypothetical protein
MRSDVRTQLSWGKRWPEAMHVAVPNVNVTLRNGVAMATEAMLLPVERQ